VKGFPNPEFSLPTWQAIFRCAPIVDHRCTEAGSSEEETKGEPSSDRQYDASV
jgi:hypothetical protein